MHCVVRKLLFWRDNFIPLTSDIEKGSLREGLSNCFILLCIYVCVCMRVCMCVRFRVYVCVSTRDLIILPYTFCVFHTLD